MSNAPGGDRAKGPRGGGDIPWKLVLWIALGLYTLAFLLMNSEKQSVSFVFFTIETRLIWLILLSMALGVLLTKLGPHLWQRRRESREKGA